MSKLRITGVIVLALALLLGGRHLVAGAGLPASGTVERVIDGDTFVLTGGAHVRLLGIDTPETVDPDRPVGCFGPQASAYTKHLLTGRRVRMVYDREHRDVYGRLLAYVYLDGAPPLFVNRRLIDRGFARTLSIPPNTAHADELAASERRAALAGVGLWGACP